VEETQICLDKFGPPTRKSLRYKIYMETKISWLHVASFRGICTWCIRNYLILFLQPWTIHC